MSDDVVCSIQDCARSVRARGWCARHYLRWSKHGDPLGGGSYLYTDPNESFLSRVTPEGDCVVWTGTRTVDGYGKIRVGRMVSAHRFAWEQSEGPIPKGMELDHTCYNRACVKVDHLRLVDRFQNMANRPGPNQNRKHALPRGVTRHGKKLQARVKHKGVEVHLGTFLTADEAGIAASVKRKELFGAYAGRG